MAFEYSLGVSASKTHPFFVVFFFFFFLEFFCSFFRLFCFCFCLIFVCLVFWGGVFLFFVFCYN